MSDIIEIQENMVRDFTEVRTRPMCKSMVRRRLFEFSNSVREDERIKIQNEILEASKEESDV
jgi:hypothetical protein